MEKLTYLWNKVGVTLLYTYGEIKFPALLFSNTYRVLNYVFTVINSAKGKETWL